jgi:hypothetical protein
MSRVPPIRTSFCTSKKLMRDGWLRYHPACSPSPRPSPRKRGRAVRGSGGGCEAAILCNQRGSPWPDLVRLGQTKSGHPRLWRGDPGRLETWMSGTSPGKGFSEAKFAAKRSARTTVQFSPDSPASGAREEKAGKTPRPAPAGRGRVPWRIGDAPPDRRTHACAERGGRVRGRLRRPTPARAVAIRAG